MCEDIVRSNSDKLTFDCQIVELHGHKILVLSGEIDLYSSPLLKQSIIGVLDGAEQHMIIDMQNVSYMDSIGIGILAAAAKRLKPTHGTVNLVGCMPYINRILSITKVDTLISSYETLDDALKALSD